MPRKKPAREQPDNILPTLLSLADAAKVLARPKASTLRVALRCGVGRQVGGMWIYTPSEVDRIRRSFKAGPGNPNMVAGNDLWKGKKKAKKA